MSLTSLASHTTGSTGVVNRRGEATQSPCRPRPSGASLCLLYWPPAGTNCSGLDVEAIAIWRIQGVLYLRLSPAPLQSAPHLRLPLAPLRSPTTIPAPVPGMGRCLTLTWCTVSCPPPAFSKSPQLWESWPDVFKRDAWVDSVAGLYEVTQYEVVVLRRIMFRCGSGSQACWESQLSMAKYLKVGRRTIQRALASLLEMGMIHKVTFYRGDNSHNAYIPTFECPPDHLRLTGANGPDLVNLPKTLDLPVHLRLTGAYMRPPGAQTVRTVTVTDHKSCDGLLSQKEDELGPENVLPQPFISAPQAQMEDVASAADVPECGSCALPWTYDVGRHRLALQRGMRVFICNSCREVEISQKVGLATPA